MNQPSLSVRITGSPVVAVPLTAGGALLVFLWTQGQAAFFLALLGFFVATSTLSSARKLKTYKAWRKEWDGVGTFGAQPAEPEGQLLPVLTVLAAILFVGILAYWQQIKDTPDLQELQQWVSLLWVVSAMFLFARACVGIRALARKRPAAKVKKATDEAVFVSWMLAATVDSPSREMAVQSLPEYAARVLNGGSSPKSASH